MNECQYPRWDRLYLILLFFSCFPFWMAATFPHCVTVKNCKPTKDVRVVGAIAHFVMPEIDEIVENDRE